MEQPLLQFKSHIEGKNAEVAVYVDRIEWSRQSGVSKGKAIAASATMGLSMLKTGIRHKGGSEMIPIKSLTSVTTERDSLRFWKVRVVASGNTIEFRVDKSEAEQVKAMLTSLMLGNHPSQASPAQPMPAASSAPASGVGVADELVKLAGLRDAGVLSAEEFETQKARLLT